MHIVCHSEVTGNVFPCSLSPIIHDKNVACKTMAFRDEPRRNVEYYPAFGKHCSCHHQGDYVGWAAFGRLPGCKSPKKKFHNELHNFDHICRLLSARHGNLLKMLRTGKARLVISHWVRDVEIQLGNIAYSTQQFSKKSPSSVGKE